MGTGAGQPGSARSRRCEDRTDRSIGSGCGRIPGTTAGVVARQGLSAGSGTARLHQEGEWETAAVGDPDGAGPSSPDGDPVDPGADFRSRLQRLLLWVPAGPIGT